MVFPALVLVLVALGAWFWSTRGTAPAGSGAPGQVKGIKPLFWTWRIPGALLPAAAARAFLAESCGALSPRSAAAGRGAVVGSAAL